MKVSITLGTGAERKKIIRSVERVLKHNELLTLATFDSARNQPCACNCYYVFDGEFNLYVWSDPQTLHGRNISKNPKVAVSIIDSAQKWGTKLQGLQMFGVASIVSYEQLERAGKLYLKRFPGASKFAKGPKGFHSKDFSDKLYKIQINKIKIFDEKSFGEFEFREIAILRN
jgi:uncharacterized protein YhbP (UPF0306 family)